MKQCYECQKDYDPAKTSFGENSGLSSFSICSNECFKKRQDRAKKYDGLKFKRVIGIPTRNGIVDIEQEAIYAFVPANSPKRIAVVSFTRSKDESGNAIEKDKQPLVGYYVEHHLLDAEKDTAEGLYYMGDFDVTNIKFLNFGDNESPIVKMSIEYAFKALCPELNNLA